jgi:nucleotide-binding universal stress UspA family protein
MDKTKERAAPDMRSRPDTYAALLVHVEPGLASAHRTEVAARLARELGARLIGVGAEEFEAVGPIDPFMGYAAGEFIALMQQQIDIDLKNAETAFRRDAAGADIEWRSVREYPGRTLARTARAADLIVMSPIGSGDETRAADPAEVVMTAGRPVLLVPAGATHLRGTAVVVAWKDTREARRAVADAMPFLRAAEDVAVVCVCEDQQVEAAAFQADDVVANLKRHGVRARAKVTTGSHEGVTLELERIAGGMSADLIVAGAYGHSRLQEWVFGGVTDDLIRRPRCFVLLSH